MKVLGQNSCYHILAWLMLLILWYKTQVFVFPELNELLKDEEVVVQLAAVQALVNLLDFLPSRIHTADVLPFIHSCAPQPSRTLWNICVLLLNILTYQYHINEYKNPLHKLCQQWCVATLLFYKQICWLSNNNHVTDSVLFLDHRLCPTEKTPVLICLARLFGDIALKVSNDQTSSDPTT